MKCNGPSLVYSDAKLKCPYPVAAKCKICRQGTCAEHKHNIGQMSPGITVTVCRKCYEKMNKLPNPGIIKKVQPNLCCVLDPSGKCVCGNIVCIKCRIDQVKPHDDCDYVRCRDTMSRIKTQL